MVKQAFILTAVAAFIALGVWDMVHHEWRVGLASVLLAIVNGLLLQ